MVGDPLPEAVCTLLREHLTSFERLEIMLLLHKHPYEAWTVHAVSESTRIAMELTREALTGLTASGLIESVPGAGPAFRFGPREPALRQAVEQLALTYRERHAAVMNLMSVHAIERIRSGSIRAFADSFIVAKRKRGS
jgi:hypothetical protein